MQMTPVISSNVIAVGYENNNLYVDYKGGRYIYLNVPKIEFENLLNAESKGKYMNKHIKGYYSYSKII